ncbi:histidine--tRNA ligase [bacterium]|nr:histidine--tRNA ligase [bacterium]
MNDSGKATKRLVTPMTLKGFRDYLPGDMISRNQVIEKIRMVYEKYGFQPIDTPVLEYLASLIGTGGEETNKQLFRLESPEREPIAMRFDLTVPFARLIAQYPDTIKLPFRRYQIGPVFRADKPGPGQFRQFTQFDIDAAGSDSVAVDAEIIAVMCEVLTRLGLNNGRDGQDVEYQVHINNRKLMNALLEGCGITDIDVYKHVLRVIDKLQKAGSENVAKELAEGRIDESGDPIDGVGLNKTVIDQILNFILVEGDSRKSIIEALSSVLPESNSSKVALQEMSDLANALDSLEVGEKEAVFDPSLTRGLDYYTGPVFETVLTAIPKCKSVMGGGRFDHLVERFLDSAIPATGASIGVDRLMEALRVVGKVKAIPTTTKVLILAIKGIPVDKLLKVANELRSAQVSTEIYMSSEQAGIRSQLSYANDREIPIAVIIGEDELSSSKVSVKDLVAGSRKRVNISDREAYVQAGKTGQVTVNRNELVQTVQNIIEAQKIYESGS